MLSSEIFVSMDIRIHESESYFSDSSLSLQGENPVEEEEIMSLPLPPNSNSNISLSQSSLNSLEADAEKCDAGKGLCRSKEAV